MKSNVVEVQNWLDTRLKPNLKHRMLDEVEIENMVHWLENYKDKSLIAQFSVDKVINSTKKWMFKLEESGRNVIEQAGDVEVLLELKDELFLVKLITKSAYQYEGHAMGHCAASYCDKKASTLYSIRDKFNKPHCTIEANKGSIVQIKGKGNRFVISKYVPQVLQALEHLNLTLSTSDMSNLGLLKVESDELKLINKVAGLEIPTVRIGENLFINNADTFWHQL